MGKDVIVACDFSSAEQTFAFLDKFTGKKPFVKIGMELYYAEGPEIVRQIKARGHKIFLDLKLHDIPNTVASAVGSLEGLPISMLTIHTCGGREMMQRALEKAAQTNPDLRLLGVTVLTSFNEEGLAETGVALAPAQQVELLAKLAVSSGMKGLVCSPLEIGSLRKILPEDVVLVTPGIRPAGSNADEQKRVMTPALAAKAGSNFIVVGRPILKADNPAEAAKAIIAELAEANNAQ